VSLREVIGAMRENSEMTLCSPYLVVLNDGQRRLLQARAQ
jgi:hypothetical protein